MVGIYLEFCFKYEEKFMIEFNCKCLYICIFLIYVYSDKYIFLLIFKVYFNV